MVFIKLTVGSMFSSKISSNYILNLLFFIELFLYFFWFKEWMSIAKNYIRYWFSHTVLWNVLNKSSRKILLSYSQLGSSSFFSVYTIPNNSLYTFNLPNMNLIFCMFFRTIHSLSSTVTSITNYIYPTPLYWYDTSKNTFLVYAHTLMCSFTTDLSISFLHNEHLNEHRPYTF